MILCWPEVRENCYITSTSPTNLLIINRAVLGWLLEKLSKRNLRVVGNEVAISYRNRRSKSQRNASRKQVHLANR